MATCRVCAEEITPPERAEVRDYCKRDECVAEAARRTAVVAVPVPKAAPMFMSKYRPGEHLDARRVRS